MKTKNILLILGVLLAAWIGIGSQIPTILPVSPITEFVDFLKGMRATGPLEVGPVGRSLKTWWNFEDFIFSPGAAGAAGIWYSKSSGAGASCGAASSLATRPGILSLDTGTTTTGYSTILSDNFGAAILFGGGIYTIEADIYISSLSTAAETFTIRFGFGDSYNADYVDGAYFEYTDVGGGTPTPNWYKCTAANGTRTKTDTTVAAVIGSTAWTRLKVVVNAAGTSVEYFINGVSVGIRDTNIPTAAGQNSTPILTMIKSAGTTARTIRADWTWLHVDLTVSR